jgi:pimeloyl-ACP methyl ester carboxylesterase
MLSERVRYDGPFFASANGIQLCYDSFGDPTDPPLILIMGLAAQMIVWEDDFCAHLASLGLYVVRFDNRDIGLSTKFPEAGTPSMGELVVSRLWGWAPRARYALVDMARDTVGLMDALGIGSAHVMGASMGGAIAQELAAHFPERVRTLTAIMSSSGDPKLPPPKPKALAVLGRTAPKEHAAFLRHYVNTWRVLAEEHFPFDEERTLQQAEATFARGINPPGVARQMLAILASGNRKEKLRELRVPTLVIHGTLDPLIPFAAGLDLAETIPGATLIGVEGMGHTLPRQVWPQVFEAIARHTGA